MKEEQMKPLTIANDIDDKLVKVSTGELGFADFVDSMADLVGWIRRSAE